MGVQVVADPGQAFGLTVSAGATRACTGRAQSAVAPGGGVGRAPLVQRFHEEPEDAGAAPHVCIIAGGGRARPRGARRPRCGQPLFGRFVPAEHGIARIVRLAVESPHRCHRGHEGRRAHRRIAAPHPTADRQFVFQRAAHGCVADLGHDRTGFQFLGQPAQGPARPAVRRCGRRPLQAKTKDRKNPLAASALSSAKSSRASCAERQGRQSQVSSPTIGLAATGPTPRHHPLRPIRASAPGFLHLAMAWIRLKSQTNTPQSGRH